MKFLKGSIGAVASSLALFASSMSIYADQTEGLTYYTENFPPYNFAGDNKKASGFNSEIVAEIFKEMASSKTINDIKVVPWARGYSMTEKADGKSVLYSTTRRPNREKLFKWAGPLSQSFYGLIVKKGNPKGVSQPDHFKYSADFKYGAIRDDVGEQMLLDAKVPKSKVQAVADFSQLVKLLEKDRIDAITYNPDVAMWLIKSKGLNTDDYEVVGGTEIGQHYMAFSKGTPDEVVEAHQKALDKVMSNKSLVDKIKSKYR